MNNPFNTLFLCRDNAVLSIIAQACTNVVGQERFRAYSAGYQPADHVHPLTLELIASYHLDCTNLRTKHWSEFWQTDAPQMDFVIALCDKDAGEHCPPLPGRPLMAQWNITDPLAAPPQYMRTRFVRAWRELDTRIRLLNCLPMQSLIQLRIKQDSADRQMHHSSPTSSFTAPIGNASRSP